MTEFPEIRLKQELIYETSSSVQSKFPFMAEIMKLEANYPNANNVDMKREVICGQMKLEPCHDDMTDQWTYPAKMVDTKPVCGGHCKLPNVCGEKQGQQLQVVHINRKCSVQDFIHDQKLTTSRKEGEGDIPLYCAIGRCSLQSQDQSVSEMVIKTEPTLLTYDIRGDLSATESTVTYISGDLSATESTVTFLDCAVSNNSLQSIFKTLVAFEGTSQHESEANEICLVAGNTESEGGEIACFSTCNEQNIDSDSPQKTHTRADVDKEFYTCHVCNLQFTESHLLKVHMKKHTEKKLYNCDICKARFTKKCQFKKHSEIHPIAYPYICNICSTSYHYEKDLRIHNQLHTGQKTYMCDICGKGFTYYKSLTAHNSIHTGDRPYLCDICSAGFVYASDMRRHRKIHTGIRPYTCDVCRKRFSRKCHLKRHQKMHTGEKPYKCAVCSAAFTRGFALNVHRRKHTGEKPYKCGVCNAGFICNVFLKQHAKRHTGEKPYMCAGSGGAAVSGFNMLEDQHSKRQDGYTCDVCNLKLSYIHDLVKHLCGHSGEKPYKCDVCNRRFSCICNIIKHMHRHTGKKPYRCIS